jgi:hypothetical protein
MNEGKSFGEALTHNINRNTILISGTAGALTSGLSALGGPLAGKAGQFIGGAVIDATESVAKQMEGKMFDKDNPMSFSDAVNNVTLGQTASDVIANKVAGVLTKKAENVFDTKIATKDADRATRISANDPSSTGRALKAKEAKQELRRLEQTNASTGQTASGTVGNNIQNTSNDIRAINKSSNGIINNTIASDATRVQQKTLIIKPQ